MAEYLAFPKNEQDDKKDIGGFVAGSFSGTRRKSSAVTGRDLITLDLDNIPSGGTNEVIARVNALGYGYCIYSTRKHTPENPRLRVLLPFDRTAKVDEYEVVARHIAAKIGMEFADPTTFEACRLMYWPSSCADAEYVFTYADKPMIPVDEILKKIDEEYGDWKDITKWPKVPGEEKTYKAHATKRDDPRSKRGIVGAFCRTYDIYAAIDTFLSDVYAPVEVTSDRYTYLRGSTTGGAVVYGDGQFLYSYHSTDPCGGKLVNSFDLVRIHKFGDLDEQAKENTPINRLPSHLQMCSFAKADPKVFEQLVKEQEKSVINSSMPAITDDNWMAHLERDSQGLICATIDNILLIMKNDPHLRDKFALNEFAGRGEVLGDLLWKAFTKRRPWSDNDNHGLYWYFESTYNIKCKSNIDSALSLQNEANIFNEVKDYLNSLQWDGIARLDTLLIDYLGAEDNEYARTVTRKAFTAAVARAMEPGRKYDTMLILVGPQGIGKSTLLDRMSKGWFNDSIRTFEGKEASELLQGVWIVEIQELNAFNKTDVARIKQFLSMRCDRFRPAYGRNVQEKPRCCVFFGTTNNLEFLKDQTGGRRFWPVDVGIGKPVKDIWRQLDAEIDQLWAEAVVRWREGETLHLTGDIEKEAIAEQEKHREVGGLEGIIQEFVNKPVPEDWQQMDLVARQAFWIVKRHDDEKLVPRNKICAAEIWCEALGGQSKDLNNKKTAEINDILRKMPEWEAANTRFGYCGRQRGFKRKPSE